MRRLIPTILVCAGLASCGPDVPNPYFVGIADELRRAARTADNGPLAIDVQFIDGVANLKLRCRLTNRSDLPVVVQEHWLPWQTMQQMNIVGINAKGETLPRHMRVNMLSQWPPPTYTLEPGAAMEGEIDLTALFGDKGLPRSEDILVLWAHSIDGTVRSGIVLIPARQ